MKEYKNRYGDIFTFTEDEDNNILWEGNFEFCRFGMPNDYTRAYAAYLEDHPHLDEELRLPLKEFISGVHEYQGNSFLYPQYVKLVDSIKDEISMVDPSGGPYISRDMKLDSFGFQDYVVADFKRIDTGYKIIIKKE